ncbi:MAG: family 20 glycosylhydrolase [Bacteroidota bacterium]|nr:family 20 glycosylhydrolase [Bacteroidota bacterium]
MAKTKRLLFLFFLLLVFSQKNLRAANETGIHIIPEPVSVTAKPGQFILDQKVSLQMTAEDRSLSETAQWFRTQLAQVTGISIPERKSGGRAIQLHLITDGSKSSLGTEGYHLTVSPSVISLSANSAAGIFYGMQTILQLLPEDASAREGKKSLDLPCADITDYPRFGWRGLMLDVSRHFFTKQEVERYLDEMVMYKFNTLHLHLSDDQGWRIEIKSLPQLTRVGAWRVKRIGGWGESLPALAQEPATDGGFYTQDDMREIVHYAQVRHVTILPEIDIPAHSLALIASYPNLSCTQLPYSVNAGFKTPVRDDNALCIGNDSVYLVLDKIFTELAAIFPSEYIHIGGDEAYKGFWADCPKCKKRMQDEHLKDVEELQSYFIKRVEKILQSKGKKLIGWDEILEGGLAPDATVMSWRGMKGGIQAAKMNHHVVMSPWDFTYLDLYQGEPSAEPPTYGMCRLSASYNYDPVPDSVDEKFILGGQGNLWTERVPNFRHAEYMTWPRGLALAEVYWSPKASRNWDDFVVRMESQFPRLDAAGIKYARSVYNAICTPVQTKDDELEVKLSTEIKGLDMYYSFDGTFPDAWYPKYKGEPIKFPPGSTNLNVITYRDGKPIGMQVSVKKEELQSRLN